MAESAFTTSGTFWSDTFALKLLRSRGGGQIALPELYGGYYLGSYEKFLRYFDDWDALESFMADECGIRDPVWFYRFEMYETFREPTSNPYLEFFVTYDADAFQLLSRAKEISTKIDSNGTKLIGLELILLATFDFEEIAVCRKLRQCGIQKEKLLERTTT